MNNKIGKLFSKIISFFYIRNPCHCGNDDRCDGEYGFLVLSRIKGKVIEYDPVKTKRCERFQQIQKQLKRRDEHKP